MVSNASTKNVYYSCNSDKRQTTLLQFRDWLPSQPCSRSDSLLSPSSTLAFRVTSSIPNTNSHSSHWDTCSSRGETLREVVGEKSQDSAIRLAFQFWNFIALGKFLTLPPTPLPRKVPKPSRCSLSGCHYHFVAWNSVKQPHCVSTLLGAL